MRFFNRDSTADGLSRWSLWLAILLAGQAVAILVLAASKTFDITTSFLAADSLRSTTSGSIVLAPASKHLFDLNMAYLVALILLIGAAAHVIALTLLKSRYAGWLRSNQNPIRRIEHGLTNGLMFVVIGVLVGMYDFVSLLLVFCLGLGVHLLFLALDRFGKPSGKTARPQQTSYELAGLVGSLPWLAIVIYLVATAINGTGQPGFVYGVVLSLMIICLGLGLNLGLYLRQYKQWKDFLFAERNFMILGFVLYSALAWQVYFGILAG